VANVSISLPVYNVPLRRVVELTSAAEDAGFESVMTYDIVQNPFTVLSAAAMVTDRIKLGTAGMVSLARSPWVMANTAADLDELSGGRAVLGLVPGGAWHLSGMHNTTNAKVIPRMREYIDCVRACWDSVGTGVVTHYQGEHYTLRLDEHLSRSLVRPRIPIYLAAMSPRMMELAGEVADGMLAHFYSPRFLREVGLPRLAAGAVRAGRDPASVDVRCYVICCVSPDRAEAWRRARIQVGFYAFLPSSDPIVRWHGLEKEQARVREALTTEGPGALERVTDDKLVEAFSIVGTPEECRAQLRDYAELMPYPMLHTPYFNPLTAEESVDAFHQILETFGD
jgi:probable F420-dependent oxidoreductase